MFRSFFVALVAAALLCACSHDVKTVASPALNVRPTGVAKLAGSYALLVDSDVMTKIVDPTSFTCGGPDYPIDARSSFKLSVYDTMAQLVEEPALVEQALTLDQLKAAGHRGQIIIRAKTYDPRLEFDPGLFSGTAIARVTIVVSLIVDGSAARLLEREVSETRTVETEVVSCASGTEALARANGQATEALMWRLARLVSDESRLRTAALP